MPIHSLYPLFIQIQLEYREQAVEMMGEQLHVLFFNE